MANEVPKPSNQLDLTNVRLAHLPVEPQHQRFRGPAFNVHVQSELLLLAYQLICNPVLVAVVDYEPTRRFPDRELAFLQSRRMVEELPVVVLHEYVGVGEFQFTLNRRHQAWRSELLALFGRGQPLSDGEPMLLDCPGEILPFTLRQGLQQLFLQSGLKPSGHCDFDCPVICFAHCHAVMLDLLQLEHEFGRRGDRMPKRGRRFIVRSEQIARAAELVLHRLDVVARLVLLEAHGHQLVRERLRRRAIMSVRTHRHTLC